MRCTHTIILAGFLAATAAAQVPLSGDVYDGHGGPLLGGVVYVTSGFTVPVGQKLTGYPWAIVKFDGGSLVVDGRLEILPGGTEPPDRLMITSIHDDTIGGDTNGNGSATLPAPGQWGGIVLNEGSFTSFEGPDIRYFGAAGAPGIDIRSSNLTFYCGTTLRFGAGTGIDFHDHFVEALAMRNTGFDSNAGVAIDNVDINDLGYHPGLSNFGINEGNWVHNNGGNYINVTGLDMFQNVDWHGWFLDGGVLVFSGPCFVEWTATFSLHSGIVKMRPGAGLYFGGSKLEILGDPGDWWAAGIGEPAVLTSFADDAWGGDTNGDGAATLPAPGDWRTVFVAASAEARVDRAIIRYAGQLPTDDAGLSSEVNTSVTRTRVEYCAGDGLRIGALPGAKFEDLVALDCGWNGIVLSDSVVNLKRATAVGCGDAGIRAEGEATQVFSSISWHNGANWVGLDGRVFYSDGPGFVGGIGNMAADPGFFDESGGELRLLPGSPCIDAGDPADQPGSLASGNQPGDLDLAGFPRLIDGNLDTLRVVDMGAYEYDNIELAASGFVEPNGSVVISTICNASFSDAFLFAGLALDELVLPHFGTLYIWPYDDFLIVPWPAASGTVKVDLPADIIPMGIWLQFGARVLSAHGAPGNLSNYVELPPPP